MAADPLDPGAMPLATVNLTACQVRQAMPVLEGHTGAVRLERLGDGYARIVCIGPGGDAVQEKRLFPE